MRVIAEAIVDWTAIGEVVLASLVAGVGVAICFALSILGATRFGERRRGGHGTVAAVYAVLALAGLAGSAAAVVLGIVVMTTKS